MFAPPCCFPCSYWHRPDCGSWKRWTYDHMTSWSSMSASWLHPASSADLTHWILKLMQLWNSLCVQCTARPCAWIPLPPLCHIQELLDTRWQWLTTWEDQVLWPLLPFIMSQSIPAVNKTLQLRYTVMEECYSDKGYWLLSWWTWLGREWRGAVVNRIPWFLKSCDCWERERERAMVRIMKTTT